MTNELIEKLESVHRWIDDERNWRAEIAEYHWYSKDGSPIATLRDTLGDVLNELKMAGLNNESRAQLSSDVHAWKHNYNEMRNRAENAEQESARLEAALIATGVDPDDY